MRPEILDMQESFRSRGYMIYLYYSIHTVMFWQHEYIALKYKVLAVHTDFGQVGYKQG